MLKDERLQKYADRLFKEWSEYGKIILSTDFDSTISPYHTLDNKDDIDRTIKLIKEAKITGCFVVVHTACREDRYEDIKRYCESVGINIDTINKNPIELPYGNEGSKPYANIYLDDRNCALPVTLDILEDVIYRVRAYNNSKLTPTDAA
jgi:hypothetical protein